MLVKESDIPELQHVMLDILGCFIQLCNENNLRYWLGGGTCLGAVRNGGFIPWDDDLDVFMPRPDYEKFRALYKNQLLHDHYKIVVTDEGKNYHHRVMQIVDVNTTFIVSGNENDDIEHGVYIDIIPFDACPKNPIKRVRQIFNSIVFSIYNIQRLPRYQGGAAMKFLVSALLALVKDPHKRFLLWKHAEEKIICADWDHCETVVETVTSFKSLLKPKPRKWFETKDIAFENIVAKIPVGADEYMTGVYGNYRELPPKEEQVPRHDLLFMDLQQSYLRYKGEKYLIHPDQ